MRGGPLDGRRALCTLCVARTDGHPHPHTRGQALSTIESLLSLSLPSPLPPCPDPPPPTHTHAQDAHEFARLLIEAMHQSCLPAVTKGLPQEVVESTFIFRAFGGRLRSQVQAVVAVVCGGGGAMPLAQWAARPP